MSPLRRRALGATVFLGASLAHFAWFAHSQTAANWVSLDGEAPPPPALLYVRAQDVWLGLSYGLALGFAVNWFLRYREERRGQARTLSAGGLAMSGVVAAGGCYLVGCCGSPLLGLYLTVFGARFLPLAKPLVFAVTLASLAGGNWWLARARRAHACSCEPATASSPTTASC